MAIWTHCHRIATGDWVHLFYFRPGCAEGSLDGQRGPVVGLRHQVPVDVQRHGRGAVTEPPADREDIHPGRDQVACVGVAQAVEGGLDSSFSGDLAPCLRNRLRQARRPDLVAEDQRIRRRLAGAQLQPNFLPSLPMDPHVVHGRYGQGDGPPTRPGLGFLKPESGLRLLKRAGNRDPTLI
jgi:hypothetical protein